MYNEVLLITAICGALIILLLFFIALPRWVFRVDEQIRLLKQICQELKKLNHGKE